MNDKSDTYFSKTIAKCMAILSLFDRDHAHRSISELSKLTGINKTSIYRFVNTLVILGYLKQNSTTKLYKLGQNSLIIGHNFLYSFDLMQLAKPIVDKVFSEHSITINSALLHGDSLLSLYRREAPNTIFFRHPLVSADLHARSNGKAVLYALNKDELNVLLSSMTLKKFTSNTITNKENLIKDLEISRNRGYSINNEEYNIGIISIGSPLINFNSKKVTGAVSLVFPKSEIGIDDIVNSYARILTKLSNEISEVFTLADS